MAKITVSIDDELLKKVDSLASEKGLASRDEFITRVLIDAVRASQNESRRRARGRMGKADEKIVEDRLKALGYM